MRGLRISWFVFNLLREAETITCLLSGFALLIFWFDFRLLSARCMPHRNWSLRIQETHSCEKALTLKQHWTIFSIFQCHIQMHNVTAHLAYSVQHKKYLRDSFFCNQSTIFLWFTHSEIYCCDLQQCVGSPEVCLLLCSL